MRVHPLPALLALLLLSALTAKAFWKRPRPALPPAVATAALAEAAAHPERPIDQALLQALRANLAIHRSLILLFAQEASLKGPARDQALAAGHQLHHESRALMYQLDEALANLTRQPAARRDPVLAALLTWIESSPELLDLDRLAFRDPLRLLQHGLAKQDAPPSAGLQSRIGKDLAEVDRLEALVDAEYRQVFAGPGKAPNGDRKRWQAYLAALGQRVPASQAPAAAPPVATPEPDREIDGQKFPDKVLVLSFDDGPHRVYTEEIKAILQRYQVPAVFFEVGRNLGGLDAGGAVALKPLAALTEQLVQGGFRIGNHSYSHAQLNKESGAPLDLEIGETDKLLLAIPGAHSHLFRFPYGARGPLQLQAIKAYHLRSVLWNIDSLDWADPIPSSVADRVLRSIAQEHRGIILFHDIHDRAGKVLPALLDQLKAQGYRFAGLDAFGELVLP